MQVAEQQLVPELVLVQVLQQPVLEQELAQVPEQELAQESLHVFLLELCALLYMDLSLIHI